MADTSGTSQSPNFGHLARLAPLLAHYGARAETYLFADANVALFTLRQFVEAMAKEACAHIGLRPAADEKLVDLVRQLQRERVAERHVFDLFYRLRKMGNLAVHEGLSDQRRALEALRLARRLGVWFQRAFGDRSFKAGEFQPPPAPDNAAADAKEELAQWVKAATVAMAKAKDLQADKERLLELEAQARQEAKEAYEHAETALRLAGESEATAAQLIAEQQATIAELQAKLAAASKPDVDALLEQAKMATAELELDEAETRLLIDAQLREAGWAADSLKLRKGAGTYPEKGRNIAIAEWPTGSGPADYILFAGLTPVGAVEAKRKNLDVAGAVEQAKRYSRDYDVTGEPVAAGAPYGEYRIPFVFSTNGRAFRRRVPTKSGIWFWDARVPTNISRPLRGWYQPQALLDLLDQDIPTANAKLAAMPTNPEWLRPYQAAAVKAVEQAIIAGDKDILLAMATGTGKTRTALCLMYRLLKVERFRRILFLVDRTSLGTQAHTSFGVVKLDGQLPLTKHYDVLSLEDIRPETDTRLHVATVQGMVKRIFYGGDEDPAVPVDWYDCIVVDECHRGYTLDREMTDGEVEFRSEAEYLSTYRRVLNHFDAVRIGLTATPALHTKQIFGDPIYEYGYRQAVVDGFLADHDPPYNIITKHNSEGVTWAEGAQVRIYDTRTNTERLYETPDEIRIDVDGLNKVAITESFNRVVCDYLATKIDPSKPGKTMVFCVTDAHADMVVDVLKQAFTKQYGQCHDDAVRKITGRTDKPAEAIRRLKNETLPNVAVTVDLLTTGIDVPEIENIVFLRRVRSRILYEQMMGRATRKCDAIGKGNFRIFDAVDLYGALQEYSDMKPVVKRPNIPFSQLALELMSEDASPGHKATVITEFLAKFNAKKRYIEGPHLDNFKTLAGMEPEGLVTLLKSGDVTAVAAWFAEHAQVAEYLDKFKPVTGGELYIAPPTDELVDVERGYGGGKKPEEFLAGFRAYIEANRNAIDALVVVTTRPRDLTRAQLRELKLQLDSEGYSESALRVATNAVSNQDVAASIIGFIRQQALGSALVPYAERVDRALKRVLDGHAWNDKQRRWLERIGAQMKVETVVDAASMERGDFKRDGGFRRANKIFEGRLQEVLGDLHDGAWEETG